MIKWTVPTVLAAITVVAAFFALAPVDEASTVHTSGTITVANDSIDADSVDGVVQPLSNVLTAIDLDISTQRVALCSGGTSEGLVYYVAQFAGDGDTIEFDVGNQGGINAVTYTFNNNGASGQGIDGISGVIGTSGTGIYISAADADTQVVLSVVCGAGDTPTLR